MKTKSEIILRAETHVPGAITRLLAVLGMNHKQLADRLGARETDITRWKSGKVVPGGGVLVMMVNLCPEGEVRKIFGLDIPQRVTDNPLVSQKITKKPEGKVISRSRDKSPRRRDGEEKLAPRFQKEKGWE